jgi:sialate O-acetylesterase
MKSLATVLGLCLVLIAEVVNAETQVLRFADVFTDNMVLQRDRDMVCWGWAKPGSTVEVLLTQSKDQAISFAGIDALKREEKNAKNRPSNPVIGKVRLTYIDDGPAAFKSVTKRAMADRAGRWEVRLGKHAASFTPTYLAARSGDERIAIKNLLIGEVWIASGQSNMAWGATRDKMWENHGLIFNGIRYAKVGGDSYTPRETLSGGGWIVCEDGAVAGLSTVPYLFGQYLHRRLKVPVGIINIAQGGSYAREWCDRARLEQMNSPTVNAQIAKLDQKVKQDPKAENGRGPATLFNARLYPLRHMAVAGVIYLQGENEALTGSLPQYGKTFPGVIASYRAAFGRPDLPFGIITLQGMGDASGMNTSSYAVARAIHQAVHRKTPNTGYIVAHDIGGGIHPNYKRPLAERAVYWALRDVYRVINRAQRQRIKQVTFDGGSALVEFESVELKDGKWTNAKAVLPRTNDQNYRAGFMIAGADRKWFPGRISVNEGEVVGFRISHPMVAKPVAVRYAWDGWSKANLGSWHDPIPPYRTDDWPIVASDEVYDPASGKPTPSELRYFRSNEANNRKLELPLQLAVTESYAQLTRRHAHPKAILLSTVGSIQELMQNFDVERYAQLAPDLRLRALHSIPVRYWRRDRYSPARRAKWGWLLERVIRLETLPRDMQQAVNKPAVKAKLAKLNQALSELHAELKKLPDAPAMTVDTMLDKVLPIMEAEKQRLTEQGIDMTKQKRELSKNPF